MVNAFVRVDGTQADLVARVPMDLLRGLPFPAADGYYDLTQSGSYQDLAKILLSDAFVLTENGARLTVMRSEARIVEAADRSFDGFKHALESTHAPGDPRRKIPYDTGYLDVHLVYQVASAGSRFDIQSRVAIDVGILAPMTVRFVRNDDVGRAMILPGGAEPVDLDPAWYRAAGGFVLLGIEHILSGTDHLLFLLCLVAPLLRVRDVVPVVTAFTVAHSITLMVSALGLAPRGTWFPPLVETAIAASIVFTALENIVAVTVGRRWLISCLFGLVHGFGFSNALGDSLQLAGPHLIVSLLAFNIGIEIGQLGVLSLVLPLLAFARRRISPAKLVVALSGIGGLLGGAWMVGRWQALWRVDAPCSDSICRSDTFPWLVLGVALLALVSMFVLHLRDWPKSLKSADDECQ